MTTTRIAPPIETQSVIGLPVTALPFDKYVEHIIHWAYLRLSKVVCVANVHMLTEARADARLTDVLYQADLVTPDGMPLVWMLKLLRRQPQDRAAGMDLLISICREAAQARIPVFFVGSEQPVLDRMRCRLNRDFPDLIVGGMESLPFGELPLPPDEERPVIEKIKATRSGVVFVSLGCPKQEKWMADHRDEIPAVMVGIGGVFPIYAGILSHAPRFIREAGLEWLYRLIQEPGRLWMRYARTIPPFVWMAAEQILTSRGGRQARGSRPRVQTVPLMGPDFLNNRAKGRVNDRANEDPDKLTSADRN